VHDGQVPGYNSPIPSVLLRMRKAMESSGSFTRVWRSAATARCVFSAAAQVGVFREPAAQHEENIVCTLLDNVSAHAMACTIACRAD
jgi:hypothetical protein